MNLESDKASDAPKGYQLKVIKVLIITLFGFIIMGGIYNIPVNAQVLPYSSQDSSTEFFSYRVRSGETLGGLAEKFGCSVAAIKSRSGLTSDIIYLGQILKIPANFIIYKVVPGDTLWGIANKHGTSIARIILFNNLTSNAIYPRQVIRVPHVSTVPRVTFIAHTVRSGDTPWTISLQYGIPQLELLSVNGLSQSSSLTIGQIIKIPVYSIPVKPTPGPQFAEYLDWWTEAQYLFPIGKIARVRDFATGRTYNIKRTTGANHADSEPLTAADAAIMKSLWGGSYTWIPRGIIVEVDGRRIAASADSMPHDIQYIFGNNFNGHFNLHFKNSTRHKDGAIDPGHQDQIKIAAGITR